MENNVVERIWKRGGKLPVECIDGNLYTGEEQAHTFRITGQDEQGTATPITGTITGKFLRADNLDVPLTGSLDGGVAVLTLTEQCYDCRGRYVLSIFADDGEHKICIYCGTGNVFRTDGEGTIDPGNIIQDVSDLINRIQAAIASCPASHSAIQAAVAPNFVQATPNHAGTYVWYDGSCYYLPDGHTAGTSWANTTKTAAVIGNDVSDLKSAINDISSSGWVAKNLYPYDQTRITGTYSTVGTPTEAHDYNVVGIGSGYGGSGSPEFRYNLPEAPVIAANDKIYLSADFRVDADEGLNRIDNISLFGKGISTSQLQPMNEWVTVRTIVDWSGNPAKTFYCRFYFNDRASATDVVCHVRNLVAVNLTELYGSGKEPFIDEFNAILDADGGFFDTHNMFDERTAIQAMEATEQIPVIEDELMHTDELFVFSTANNYKLLDTGYSASESGYVINKYKVVAGERYRIVSTYKFQFQNKESTPTSGTLSRVGNTFGEGTYDFVAPADATFIAVSGLADDLISVSHLAYAVKDKVEETEGLVDDIGFVLHNQAMPDETKKFTSDYSTTTVEGRTIKNTAIGSSYGGTASGSGYYTDHFDVNAGDKVYLYAKASVSAGNASRIRLTYCGNTAERNSDIVKDTVYQLSNVITCSNITNKHYIAVYQGYADRASATDAVLTVSDLILINLTKDFGAGNEPDKAYMDALIAETGWFRKHNLLHGQSIVENVDQLLTDTAKIAANVFVDVVNHARTNATRPNDGSQYAEAASSVNVSASIGVNNASEGDIVYYYGEYRPYNDDNNCASLYMSISNGRANEISDPVTSPSNDQWYAISTRAYKNNLSVGCQAVASWDSTATTKRIYYRHVVALNLTTIFGKYNEPSKEMLDRYFYSVSQVNALDFESESIKMLNLAVPSRELLHPKGNYVRLDEEGNVTMGSVADPAWEGWNKIGKYGQFNVGNIPIYNKVHGTLETDGMLSVLPIWGCWSEAASSGNTHHGGHVFHGWTTDRQHRLTMVQNIYRDDEAAVFNYIPGDKSGTSEGVFLRLRLGADNNYKGVLIENEYGGTNNTDYHLARMTVYGRLNIARHSNYDNIPASANAPGVKGDICVDGNYIYVCTVDNTWKRVPLQEWT